MFRFYRIFLLAMLCLAGANLFAQTPVKGRVIDRDTREPLPGASIRCSMEGCACGCTTNAAGEFEMHCSCGNCKDLKVTSTGYITQLLAAPGTVACILLEPAAPELQEVVVSATRGESVKRSLAPVAITALNHRLIQDAKPTTADQVLNKVSGVNMVSLGNEQHQMSIRQPMTTKSLFLYLQDGIPIRTTGLFNHNALLEMNLTATKSIEVIKGPSSSLYGSEAIGGVVNFITMTPSEKPVLRLSAQGNDIGYKRADLVSSFQQGRWGVVLSGYYAGKKNGYLEYSDYHKGIVTAKLDYRFSAKTQLSNSISWLNYYSDMPGGIDSAMFSNRSFNNLQTFTYRKVEALRYHATLTQQWNERGKTSLTVLFRDNTISQNPAYRIRDDYRRQGSVFVGKKGLAHGEINRSRFNSYGFIAQHKQAFNWKNTVLIAGLNADLSPSSYDAGYIRINKDTLTKKYRSYQETDSVLTKYATRLNNYAAFLNIECSPLEKWRVVASLRYDLFRYRFNNHLPPSAFSGSPDTLNHFSRLSPKIGFTYNFSGSLGLYANYSQGFVPPQVTEMYTGVKVPDLRPSVFYNYEAGGWAAFFHKKLSVDASLYWLRGTNEVINVKREDGTYENQNAGITSHRGLEFGVNANPVRSLSFRFSGAWSRHEFVEYTEKGTRYDGNEMNNAPRWICNTELWYRPGFAKGLRLGVEWQHIGKYFADMKNSAVYGGYDVWHFRAGYRFKHAEVWMNLLNLFDRYYAYIVTKSVYGYSYQVGEPRNINLGLSFDIASLLKQHRK